ncbi:uncharacterized protein EKO05_0008172 [Ascochyta rabiei]|uniref:uncharacterized protein n=1 Tax=Didymella rabiei TaxID=5454 RepID=UPI0021FF0284|nr:uncharacterized protein EKO05_0008172 [Ascochyta rabiei]UPX17845.1 hypothetical protein EKO05_0008172 [Ascochyta rabiei]
MSNNQYSLNYASYNRNTTATHFQTVNPYAALVATAGPEHDGRSSSSGSAPSIGSSSSLVGYKDAGPSRSYTRSYSSSGLLQQHVRHRLTLRVSLLVPTANHDIGLVPLARKDPEPCPRRQQRTHSQRRCGVLC